MLFMVCDVQLLHLDVVVGNSDTHPLLLVRSLPRNSAWCDAPSVNAFCVRFDVEENYFAVLDCYKVDRPMPL